MCDGNASLRGNSIRGVILDNVFDSMYYDRGDLIGGIDEAGVVDIAGPLVAACVVLPKINISRDDLRIFEVNDSKKIPEKYRKRHAETVWQVAVGIGIGEVSPIEVDYFGSAAAIKLAMVRAVVACKATTSGVHVKPDFLLIDGTHKINFPLPQEVIAKGDSKSLSIASASIVAKVYRDELMIKLAHQFPRYDWASNKGHDCKDQFAGMDHYGVELGVHRIRTWPFIARENKKRSEAWKKITFNRTMQELNDQWMALNPPSSKPSNNSEEMENL
jgi:ribonuclease HII